MRKALSLLALLTIMGIGKVCSQSLTIFIWDGDRRFGISGGLAIPMAKTPIFKTDNSITFDEKSFSRYMAPSFGLFGGMEKDVSGNFRFGFQGWIAYSPNKWKADFLQTTNSGINTISYDYTSKRVNITEDVYVAKANCKTINAQGVVYETNDNYFHASGAPFSIYLGADATAGVTYYLGEAFYVSFHAGYTYVAFDFSSVNASDSFFMDNLGNGIKMSETIPSLVTGLVTIGFKW